jgi:hypothetical protein
MQSTTVSVALTTAAIVRHEAAIRCPELTA